MGGDDSNSESERRRFGERRSGADTRSELEKQLVGERRSGADRREGQRASAGVDKPSDAQLALFARRLRRALRDEKGRQFFGVTRGEYDFAIYPEVLKTVEWIESLAGSAAEEVTQPPTAGGFTLRKTPSGKDI
jgi:hypothetical protein